MADIENGKPNIAEQVDAKLDDVVIRAETKEIGSHVKGGKLAHWDPENETFWNKHGNAIAMKNLMISFPNLLLMFATWIIWSILVVQIQNTHDADPTTYAFQDVVEYEDYANPTAEEMKAYKVALFMLPSIAGIGGATLRTVNTFMVAVCGGQVHNAMNSLLAIIPMAGIAMALANKECTFTTLVIWASLSGFGGGAFSSSMSNISFFFPKRKQGFCLGVNAGLGNLGVSMTQLLIPVMCSAAIFGGPSVSDPKLISKWPGNGGVFYAIMLAIFGTLALLFMNSMPEHGSSSGSTVENIIKYLHIQLLGIGGVAMGTLLFMGSVPIVGKDPVLSIVRIFLLSFVACIITLVLLRYCSGEELGKKLQSQAKIFKNKHTWLQTWLYMMTFGSFIGYSSAFPKLINDLFGYMPDGVTKNPNAPSVGTYAWMGAAVGSLARVGGGMLADKFGGATVTHWGTVVEIAATIAVGVICSSAKGSEAPDAYFPQFLVCFLLLFASTGSSNGSTFRQMSVLFEAEQRGPVLGWTAAVAAYGAAIFPAVFAAAGTGSADAAMYAFAAYYCTCLLINYWYYYRNGCEAPC